MWCTNLLGSESTFLQQFTNFRCWLFLDTSCRRYNMKTKIMFNYTNNCIATCAINMHYNCYVRNGLVNMHIYVHHYFYILLSQTLPNHMQNVAVPWYCDYYDINHKKDRMTTLINQGNSHHWECFQILWSRKVVTHSDIVT